MERPLVEEQAHVGVLKVQIAKLERNASNVTLDTLRKVFAARQTVVKIRLVSQA